MEDSHKLLQRLERKVEDNIRDPENSRGEKVQRTYLLLSAQVPYLCLLFMQSSPSCCVAALGAVSIEPSEYCAMQIKRRGVGSSLSMAMMTLYPKSWSRSFSIAVRELRYVLFCSSLVSLLNRAVSFSSVARSGQEKLMI